jgi:hypothetical protein
MKTGMTRHAELRDPHDLSHVRGVAVAHVQQRAVERAVRGGMIF